MKYKKIRAINLKRAIELDKHMGWTYVQVAQRIANNLPTMQEREKVYDKLIEKFIPYYDI